MQNSDVVWDGLNVRRSFTYLASSSQRWNESAIIVVTRGAGIKVHAGALPSPWDLDILWLFKLKKSQKINTEQTL